MNPDPPAEITRQLSEAQAVLERHLGDALIALHLFGSAVDGGLKPHSDIDLLSTVNAPLDEPARRALMKDLLSVSAWPGTREDLRALEVTILVRDEVVPWRYPPMRELQFGEWLREDLLSGLVPPVEPDPDLAILLTQARLRSICLLGSPAAELFEPVPGGDFTQALCDTVAQWNEEADWRGDERNVVLALARVWFSAVTGGMASKDVAAAWALERLPKEYQPIVADARAAYLDGAPDDLAKRNEQVAAFVRYVRETIRNPWANPSG